MLHPDEVHDGAAGDEAGLIYRMIYLPPEMIAATGASPGTLPFVADPVVRDAGLWQALADILADLDGEPGDLQMDDVLMRLAAGLVRQAGMRPARASATAETAVRRARDYLGSPRPGGRPLGNAGGGDGPRPLRAGAPVPPPHRHQPAPLSGHAPTRPRQAADRSGNPPADAALDAGFADQAHFTRHFRNAFGMTPGRWLAMQTAA